MPEKKKKEDLNSVRNEFIDALLRLWRVKHGLTPLAVIAANRAAFQLYGRTIFTELRSETKVLSRDRAELWQKLPGCAEVDFVCVMDPRERGCKKDDAITRTREQITVINTVCDKFEKTAAGKRNLAAVRAAIAGMGRSAPPVATEPTAKAELRQETSATGPSAEEVTSEDQHPVNEGNLSTIRQQAAGALMALKRAGGSRLGDVVSRALEAATGVRQGRWVVVLGGGDGMDDDEIEKIRRKLRCKPDVIAIALLRPIARWSERLRDMPMIELKGLIADWRTATLRAQEDEDVTTVEDAEEEEEVDEVEEDEEEAVEV